MSSAISRDREVLALIDYVFPDPYLSASSVIVVLTLLPHGENVGRALVLNLKQGDVSGIAKRHDQFPELSVIWLDLATGVRK